MRICHENYLTYFIFVLAIIGVFLMLGISAASTGESRVLFGEIDASINSLGVNDFGTHYFEFEYNGESTLFYSGYAKSSPVYPIQTRSVSEIWEITPSGFFCGTGLGLVAIHPNESVVFQTNHAGKDIRVGIRVRTDPTLRVNSKLIWSEEREES